MTILFVILCLLTMCFPVQSLGEGIFGLKKGMSIDEIRALDFGDIKQHADIPDAYVVNEPKKPKDAATVSFVVTPKNGLLRIHFVWVIQTNVYGNGIRDKFNKLHDILTKKYGKGKNYDFLRSDSIWNRPKDWMMGLLKGERALAWVSYITDSNSQNLELVFLQAKALSREEAALSLTYDFQGAGEWEKTKNAEEASQF